MQPDDRELLLKLLKELKDFNCKNLQQKENLFDSEWISRSVFQDFLGYQDTQFATLEKRGDIIVSKIGKRKFYRVDSIKKILDENIQK